MSYQVFARKYRPRTFRELLGQDHVVRTLENAIAQERLAHAYLFVGPRGTGKTSAARIFAKALNCPGGPTVDFDPDDPTCIEIAEGRSLDVLEIDGASNNGVEQVRELRETVSYAPASGRFKIYYIDEVHMLSNAAFNALLKTLEEPPPHVKFIFATTEPHKVLPTIISRCQRFDLRRIPQSIIASHLLYIAKEEGVKLDDLAAHSIARGADGGMRDAQSMLDQLVAFCGESITEEDVLSVFGFTAHETIATLSGQLLAEDAASALRTVGEQADSGKDLQRLLADLISWIRTLIVFGVDPEATIRDAAPEVVATLQEQGGKAGNDRLLAAIDSLAEAEANMRWAPDKKLHFEVAMVKACQAIGSTSISDLIQMLGGEGTPPPPKAKAQPAASPPAAAAPAASPSPAAAPETPSSATAPPPAPSAPESPEEPAPDAPSAEPEAEPSPAPSLSEILAEVEAEKAATAEPIPEAAASPPAEAADSEAAAPAAVLSEDQIWPAALALIQAQRPLVATWAEDAHDLGLTDNILNLGFAPEAAASMQSLERPATREDITTLVTQVAGRPLKLKFEVQESLAPIEPAPAPEEAEPATDEKIIPITQDAGASSDSTVSDSEPEAPAEEAKEDMYDDALVKDALEVFAATLEERKKNA